MLDARLMFDFLASIRFGVLALELAKWLVAGCREDISGKQHITALCLKWGPFNVPIIYFPFS